MTKVVNENRHRTSVFSLVRRCFAISYSKILQIRQQRAAKRNELSQEEVIDRLRAYIQEIHDDSSIVTALKALTDIALGKSDRYKSTEEECNEINAILGASFELPELKKIAAFLMDAINAFNYKHLVWSGFRHSNCLISALGDGERAVGNTLQQRLIDCLVKLTVSDPDFVVRQIEKSKAISHKDDIDIFGFPRTRALSVWFIACEVKSSEPLLAYRLLRYAVDNLHWASNSLDYNYDGVVNDWRSELMLVNAGLDGENQVAVDTFLAHQHQESLRDLIEHFSRTASADFFQLMENNQELFDDGYIQENLWGYIHLLDHLSYEDPKWALLLKRVAKVFLERLASFKIVSAEQSADFVESCFIEQLIGLLANAIEVEEVYGALLNKLDDYYHYLLSDEKAVRHMGYFFQEVSAVVYSFYGKNNAVKKKIANSTLSDHISKKYKSFVSNAEMRLEDRKDVSEKLSSMIAMMYSGSDELRAWTKTHFIKYYESHQEDEAICVAMLTALANNLAYIGRDYAFSIRSKDDEQYKTQHEILDAIKPEGFQFKSYCTFYANVAEWNE